jgi:hypothetical protein
MTRTEITFWALAAIIILSAFAILAAIANPAKATDWDWSMSGDSYHSHKQKPRRKYRRKAPEPEIRYYAPPRDDEDLKFCVGPVRGVGTQWLGEDGAMDAATKDWRERVRYDLGEIFVDITHAEDFRKRCGRTSIGETLGQVLFRCEVWARPCKAEFSEGELPKK